MARGAVAQRTIDPDLVYESSQVAKFVNHVMNDGKKTTARRIVYGALEDLRKEINQDPVQVFEQAIENVAPVQEVRPKRVGGATYQVPMDVKGHRRMSLAMRWIIQSARSKKGSPMRKRLTEELLAAYKKEGEAFRKKENTHRMAEANKAFAHFAR